MPTKRARAPASYVSPSRRNAPPRRWPSPASTPCSRSTPRAKRRSPPSNAAVPIRRLTIPGRLDQIEAACDCVAAGARAAGCDDSTSYACQLAVAEACENIVKHGYGALEPGEIRVAVTDSPGELVVRLEDSGPPLDRK